MEFGQYLDALERKRLEKEESPSLLYIDNQLVETVQFISNKQVFPLS